jgi:hypothetical protein
VSVSVVLHNDQLSEHASLAMKTFYRKLWDEVGPDALEIRSWIWLGKRQEKLVAMDFSDIRI